MMVRARRGGCRRGSVWLSGMLAAIGLLIASLLPGAASASTIGGTGGGILDCAGFAEALADSSYVIPAGGGAVTSFSFDSTGDNAGETLDFLMLRPAGGILAQMLQGERRLSGHE